MKNNDSPEQPPKQAKLEPYLPNSDVPIEPTEPAMRCAAAHSIQTCVLALNRQPRFLIFSPLAWNLARAAYQQEAAPGMPMEPTHYAGIVVALNKQFPGIIVVAVG